VNPFSGLPIPPSTITGYTRQLDGVSGLPRADRRLLRWRGTSFPPTDSPDQRIGTDVAFELTWDSNHLVPEFQLQRRVGLSIVRRRAELYLRVHDKNTTLSLGWSHAYDQVLANQFTFLTHSTVKNTDTSSSAARSC